MKGAEVVGAFAAYLIERGRDVTRKNADYTDVIHDKALDVEPTEVGLKTTSPWSGNVSGVVA